MLVSVVYAENSSSSWISSTTAVGKKSLSRSFHCRTFFAAVTELKLKIFY